jgi:alkanesulfonate monooxygenase SsuD/methylene tetrahydromethanopterin reductase-like flavin-dependent oxidoreductase (luciferase family)
MGYGMQMKERSRRADEMLEIIRRLWEGETVTFKGKYFSCEKAKLTPRPVQQPRPPIYVGGFAPNAV